MKKLYTFMTVLFLWPVLMYGQGSTCADPISVDFDTDLPYADSNQTTCGLGNDYSSTCLGSYDGGEEIVYEFTLTSPMDVVITFDPNGTTWTGIALLDGCPDTGTCIGFVTGSSSSNLKVISTALAPGTYYFIADTWPTPNCITDFHLNITGTVLLCGGVTGLGVSEALQTELSFNWNGDGNTSWDWAVDSAGFDINTATLTNTADTFATATGLTEGYTYDIYVRTNCGSDLGEWSMVTKKTPSVGDNCDVPIVVDLDNDLPYADLGQNTCGRGVPYNSSCLGSYDGGESVVYRLDLASTMSIKIQMDPNGTTWTGLGLFDDCPDVGSCIAIATGSSSAVREIVATLDAGTYFVMASTYPSPTCIPVLDLTIEQLLCGDVSGLGLNSLTTTEAVVNWNSDSNTSWDYAVDVAGFDINTATLTNTADTFFTASSLLENTAYEAYVRTNCGAELGDWAILAFTTPMTPINGDSCEVATVITDNGVYNCSPLIGVGSQGYAAAWFSFTPTVDGSIDVYSCYGGSDTRLWIWSGDCDNLVAVANTDDDCIYATDSTGSSYAAAEYGVNVVAGTTYYIEWDARWSDDAFFWNFEYSEVVVEYPVNDECDGATITDVTVGVTASVSGDGTNATAGATFPVAEVWEAFTLSECANVVIDFCGSDPLATALYVNLFTECPIGSSLPAGTVTLIECAGSDSALSVSFNGLEAGTYYYPVIADVAGYNGFGPYTMNINAVACPPAGPLETCELSEEVFAPSTTSNTGLTGTGGSQGIAAAWYHYTATADGFINVTSCLGGADTRLWIWEGACDNLVAVADTDDDCAFMPDGTGFEYAASLEGIPVTNGTTYYIEWDATWSADPFDWSIEFSSVVSDTCSTFLGGPWGDFNTTFGGAPVAVDGVCPFNEITAFEVWASESYTVDGFLSGETYTFSMCNGSYGAWPAELSVWDENGDIVVFLSDTCSISWTATYDGTYVIGINEVGACGNLSSNTSTDNGFPALTCDGATGIEDITLANFTIYPNPNNGQFSIVNEGVSGNYIIELIDVTGRVVYSEQLQLNSNDLATINSTDVNTGVYLVKMTNTDENYYRTLRMVIK